MLGVMRDPKVRNLILLSLVFLSLSIEANSPEPRVSIGDYVIVYAEIKNCPNFPGIIEVREITERDVVLLELSATDVLGNNASEIKEALLEKISTARPGQELPRTLRIEVLKSRAEYLLIRDQALESIKYRFSGACSSPLSIPKTIKEQPITPEPTRIARFFSELLCVV